MALREDCVHAKAGARKRRRGACQGHSGSARDYHLMALDVEIVSAGRAGGKRTSAA